MKALLILLGLSACIALQPSGAFAEGDAAAGKNVYKKCVACHDVTAEKNKVGPHLVGIIGRVAALAEGFKYSDALKAKGAEGFMWSEENLATYLKKPKDFIPGIKMAFAGIKDDAEIANLIAYLKADPKP